MDKRESNKAVYDMDKRESNKAVYDTLNAIGPFYKTKWAACYGPMCGLMTCFCFCGGC